MGGELTNTVVPLDVDDREWPVVVVLGYATVLEPERRGPS
jgi:hypothetical protein